LKAHGDCIASCVTIASCFTCSLHSPSMGQSKKRNHQYTLEAPVHQCTSVCTSCRAAQCLHHPDVVLLLQPQRKCQHQAQKCPVHRGCARESCAVCVPHPVVRLLQHEQEGHDANGHVLASNFVGNNLTPLHLQEGQSGIFREGFQQEREREEASCYQFHSQGSQESPL
jgi:hypothetical protein